MQFHSFKELIGRQLVHITRVVRWKSGISYIQFQVYLTQGKTYKYLVKPYSALKGTRLTWNSEMFSAQNLFVLVPNMMTKIKARNSVQINCVPPQFIDKVEPL